MFILIRILNIHITYRFSRDPGTVKDVDKKIEAMLSHPGNFKIDYHFDFYTTFRIKTKSLKKALYR